MHVELPEKVELITIDTSWTKLEKVVPNAFKNLVPNGRIIALVKPHYEAVAEVLRQGRLPESLIPKVLSRVKSGLEKIGVEILSEVESPLLGEKGKNKEYLLLLKSS